MISPCVPQQRGVRIYLHRLAHSRSSAHPPCRCDSGHPPAGSRAGRCSHSGNPSARLLSTRRSPAAPLAARGTGFLGWREQRGEGSGYRPCEWAEHPGLAAVGACGDAGKARAEVTHVGNTPSRTSGDWAGTGQHWDPPAGTRGCSSARSVSPGCCGRSCPGASNKWPLRGGY